MRMRKKQKVSVILTCALVVGSFAGTGITARAGMFEIAISSEKMDSGGGELTVIATGEGLKDEVWWTLEKQIPASEGDEAYETVGEKMYTADVGETHTKSEFTVDIPENTKDTEEIYRIRVSESEPCDSGTDGYIWGEESEKIVVEARLDETEEQAATDNEVLPEDDAADGKELMENGQVPEDEPLGVVADTPEEEIELNDTKVPAYHTIPAYQQKDLYSTPSVTIKGIPIEVNVDGTPGGRTEPYTEPIKFKIVNTTKQEQGQIVEAKGGIFPDLNLVDNHTYIIYSLDPKYKIVRDEKNSENVLAKNAYIWVKDGKIKDIKENADYPYNYPDFEKIQIAERSETRDSKDDDRVTLSMETLYKNGGGKLSNVKIKLVSAYETLEVDSGNSGRITTSVLEDVNYIPVVESDKWDIEAFPLTAKDKSEYRTDKNRRGERYFYDHSTCKQVEKLYLVDKKDAHKNDRTVTSLSGNTTVSGFNFNDFFVMEKSLDKSLVTELNGKAYDVLSISTVNPHRWEIAKLAAGNFYITEKINVSKKVVQVYYINEEGKLQSIPFSQNNNIVGFSMNSMSVYPVVFEYSSAPRAIVQNISISGLSKNIASGKKLRLTAQITPANAESKGVTWTSSNTKYATVDANGWVTAKKAGVGKTVRIIATAKDGTEKQAVYQIKIMKDAVKKINLKAKKTIKAGKKFTIKATIKTTGKKANKKLAWTSSNTKYATVNSKGRVTAKKAGKGKKVKITARATDGSGKKKTVTIKIK